MPRPANKDELLEASQLRFEELQSLLDVMAEKGITTRLDFSDQPQKKEAHWSRDKDVKDVIIHLYEWHQLLLTFVLTNQAGQAQPFLLELYN